MYFDIPIYDDVMYLLEEIGNNCKVNNVDCKAIVNNTNNEYDDKRIITNEELKRGDYINYNDLFFIVVDDVVDKRYKTYYKSKMRKCNYDVKFIVDGKLYQFPAIVEGEKFYINENKLMDMASDIISVTLPETEITKQIQKQQGFIKFGQKWEVQGIDYTKAGLIILNCKITTFNKSNDDLDNEIADRWIDSIDILDGNITPILPFPEEYKITFEIKEGETIITDAIVELKDSQNNIILPETDGSYIVEVGTYSYTVTKEGYITKTGTIRVIDTDIHEIVILEQEIIDNFTYEITGKDSIMWNQTKTYTVRKYNNGVEVDGAFTFVLTGDNANIVSSTDNTVDIKAKNSVWGNVTLKAIDVDNGEIVTKEILIKGLI